MTKQYCIRTGDGAEHGIEIESRTIAFCALDYLAARDSHHDYLLRCVRWMAGGLLVTTMAYSPDVIHKSMA